MASIAAAYVTLDDDVDERYLSIQTHIDRVHVDVRALDTVIETERKAATRSEIQASSKAFEEACSALNKLIMLIKDLLEQARVAGIPVRNDTEKRLYQALYDVHVRRYREAVAEYRTQVNAYRVVVDARTQRFILMAEPTLGQAQAQRMVRGGIEEGEVRGMLDDTILDLQERYEGVRRLERTVYEIHEMFALLGSMIEDQDIIVTRIQDTLANTVESSKATTASLRVARRDADTVRRRQVIILVICLICLLVAIVVLTRTL